MPFLSRRRVESGRANGGEQSREAPGSVLMSFKRPAERAPQGSAPNGAHGPGRSSSSVCSMANQAQINSRAGHNVGAMMNGRAAAGTYL